MDANAESSRELIYFRFHLSARRADGEVTVARIKIEEMMHFLFPNMAFIHKVEPWLKMDGKKFFTPRSRGFDVPSTSMEN
jgi:hypothetical protein